MDDLERLVAIEDIKQLKARYFRAVDQKDRALLRSVFTDDAVVDYRGAATDPSTGVNAIPVSSEKPIHGADAIAETVMLAVKNVVSVHHGVMPEIEITGKTTASGIWPMVDRLRFDSGGPVAELVGYGYYYETYEKIHGTWKIKTLKLPRLRVDNTPG